MGAERRRSRVVGGDRYRDSGNVLDGGKKVAVYFFKRLYLAAEIFPVRMAVRGFYLDAYVVVCVKRHDLLGDFRVAFGLLLNSHAGQLADSGIGMAVRKHAPHALRSRKLRQVGSCESFLLRRACGAC